MNADERPRYPAILDPNILDSRVWQGAHWGRPERDPGDYEGRHRTCTCSTIFVHWRRKCPGPLATMLTTFHRAWTSWLVNR